MELKDRSPSILMEELSFPFSIYRRIVKGHDLHFGYWDASTGTLEEAQEKLTALMLERVPVEALDILDVGCGFGHFAYRLAQRGHRVTALAPEPFMIAYARQRFVHTNVNYLCETFEGKGSSWWKPASYDLIVFFESSQYFSSLDELFGSCAQLLRPQGRILLCDEMLYDEKTADHTAVKPKRSYMLRLAECGFKIRYQKALGPHTAPTCAAVLERLSREPPDKGRDLLEAGWRRQQRMHESGAWGYEILEAEKDAYRMQPCSAEDDPHVVDLFRQVFSAPRSMEHWRWKYRECPFGRDAVVVCRDPDGHIVANFSGYYVPVEDLARKAAPLLVLQVGDTMTHPSVRHVGFGKTSLLVRTAHYFFARFCEMKVPFVYGFNTGNIQKMGKLFLGYRPVYPLDEYTLSIDTLKPSLYSFLGYTCREITRFSRDHDLLYERAKRAYGRFVVIRKSDYLNWRFADPDKAYRIFEVRRRFGMPVGYLVAEKKGDGAVVGDVFWDPEHVRALERALRRMALTMGVRHVSLWLSKTPPWLIDQLLRIGFQRQPEPLGLWFVFVPFQMRLREDDMEGFYFTKADSDLF